MKAGDMISWTRTFTKEDVISFSGISGDQGSHHILPNEQGRFMVQGLLTATLPTKIGGEINFIARDMLFQFHHPVYSEDTVRCDVMIDDADDSAESTRLTCSWTCTNQDGAVVMTGKSHGIVRRSHHEEKRDQA